MYVKKFDEFINESRNPYGYYGNRIDEGLFGSVAAPDKPKVELTADFIRENNPDVIAEAFFNNVSYAMYKVGSDVDKAINFVVEGLKDIMEEIKSDAELAKKFIEGIGNSILNSMKNAYGYAKKAVTAIPNFIVFSLAFLVKLGISGIDSAKEGIKKIYGILADAVKKAYEEIKGKLKDAGDALEGAYNSVKDKVEVFTKLCYSIILAVAKKISGAAEAFGSFLKQLFNDAKEKVVAAVMIVKQWLKSKASDVANYVKSTAGDIADAIKETWKSFSRKVRNAYTDITDKLNGWLDTIKAEMNKIGQKISEIAGKAGDKLISVKDATASAVIKKGVKALNKKNYSLDQVIDMVTKAYNESLFVDEFGELVLNENIYNFNLSMID